MYFLFGRSGHGPRISSILSEKGLALKILPSFTAVASAVDFLSENVPVALETVGEVNIAYPELEHCLCDVASSILCDDPFSGSVHEIVVKVCDKLSPRESARAHLHCVSMWVFEQFSQTRFYASILGAQQCLSAGWQRLPSTYTVAKVSAGIGVGCIVLSLGRTVWRRRCLDSFSSENLPFDGDARQPLCVRCTPTIAEGLDAGKGWEKLVTVKTRCRRCCRFPQLFAEDKHIKVTISDEIHRSVNMYSCLQLGRVRDVHGPMETVLDNLPNHNANTAILMNLIGNFCRLESTQRTKFGFPVWNEHTDSYMMATRWFPRIRGRDVHQASASEPTTLHPPENPGRRNWRNFQHVAAFMRPYWEWVFTHNNQLPQVSLVSPEHTVLDEHSNANTANADPLGLNRTLTQTLVQGEDITAERPDFRPMLVSTAKDLVFEAKGNAVKCGPLLSKPLIHNTGDKTHVSGGVESRTLPEPGYTYDKSSPSAKRLSRYWCKMNTINYTVHRIKQAYLLDFGAATSLSDLKIAGYSKERLDEAAINIEGYRNIGRMPKRKANAKLELVEKEAGEQYKSVRLTYDNGLELLYLGYLTTKIFQSLMYGKELGMFYQNSIKGRPREDVIRGLLRRWKSTSGDMCGFEIDQTGMERHTRGSTANPGLMSPIYTILKKICAIVCKECLTTHAFKYETKLIIDHTHGLCFNIKVKTGVRNQTESLLVRFDDLYLDSGWSMTSGVNFSNELSGLLCTCFENPEHVFATDKDGQMYILQNDENGKCLFDWEFRTVPLYLTEESTTLASTKSKFDPSIEGDDGAGMLAKVYADPRNQQIVEDNQKELGYAAKLIFIITGRLEYIGIHMQWKDGKPYGLNSWCPGIMRTIGKIGAKVGNDNTPQAQLARFLSISGMFSDNIQPMCEAFMNSAHRVLNQHGQEMLDQEIEVREWDDNWKAGLSEGKHILRDIYDNACHKMATTIGSTVKDQIKMINTSIFKKQDGEFTGEHYARFQYFASQLQHSEDDEANFCALPQPLWPKPPTFSSN